MDYISHSGTPHEGLTPHSGRYAWGSGENAFQRLDDGFTRMVRRLRKEGMTDEDIVKGLGLNNVKQLHEREATAKVVAMKAAGYSNKQIAEKTGLTIEVIRDKTSYANEFNRNQLRQQALKLVEKGIGATEGAKIMGLPRESSFRSLLDESIAARSNRATNAAAILKEEFKTKPYLDIGAGAEIALGISDTRLKTAVRLLEEEGYERLNVYVDQMGTGHKTTVKTLCPPGTTIKDVYDNLDGIKTIGKTKVYDAEGNLTSLNLEPFTSVDSKRVSIRYSEDGGKLKDGVIELKPGVPDISLGGAQYAQVRIAVDNTHYLKGMAIYGDPKDFPKGTDIIFNTNKSKDVKKMDVLKPMKTDEANPFGASIKRTEDLVTAQKKGSAINIVNEEGDWDNWSKTLASQFLSKQPVELAKKQLNLTYQNKVAEMQDIMAITNPTLKKKMLVDFADDCDASAVHLKSTYLPGQAAKVILPVPKLPENQVYAPHLNNGERVVLIRYPHGGQFEIPELTVNNNFPAAKKSLGNKPTDAIGINSKTAQQLSGADFDGDTVIVIPVTRNGKRTVNIQTKAPFENLKEFDTEVYKLPDSAPKILGSTKQKKMGEVSNLITDMTIKGASDDELERAVRHSMVVIDSEKHHLNYQQSYKDNNIKELKKMYQEGGASTIISRAKSDKMVDKRYDTRRIDPDTGAKIFKYSDETYVDAKGVEQHRKIKSTKMYEATDARTLMSKNPTKMEMVYADYANQVKALANKARKTSLSIKDIDRNPSIAKKYAAEVQSLKDKLKKADENKPRERQAQIIANLEFLSRTKDNVLDEEAKKKIRGQALASARSRVGASKERVRFTDREWEAIQAGAVTKTLQTKLFNAADSDRLRELATPKTKNRVTPSMVTRIKAMSANPAYTIADISNALGLSPSTISKYIRS